MILNISQLSGLVNAVSSAGARGVWQFMPATAKEEVWSDDHMVDERYMTWEVYPMLVVTFWVLKQFADWTLAAASYNGEWLVK
jgi:hypothetical protein